MVTGVGALYHPLARPAKKHKRSLLTSRGVVSVEHIEKGLSRPQHRTRLRAALKLIGDHVLAQRAGVREVTGRGRPVRLNRGEDNKQKYIAGNQKQITG